MGTLSFSLKVNFISNTFYQLCDIKIYIHMIKISSIYLIKIKKNMFKKYPYPPNSIDTYM